MRRKHLGYGEFSPTVTTYQYGGLIVTRTLFQEGQVVRAYYPKTVPIFQWESAHVLLSGRMSRDNRPPIEAGWNSRTDQTLCRRGLSTRTVLEDSEMWCCLGTEERSSHDAGVLNLAAGDVINLHLGWYFLFCGTSLVGDSQFQAPVPLRVVSEGKKLEAITDCWMFMWP